MIAPEYVRVMAAYNAEMDRRVYGAAARLSDAARRADRGAFWGSIHATLAHVLWADRVWLARLGFGAAPRVRLADSGALIADFDVLRVERTAQDVVIGDWASGLSQADLEGDLRWRSEALGRELLQPRALCIVHLFNHQTHHRGQVHALLTAQGETTGATDLPFVLV